MSFSIVLVIGPGVKSAAGEKCKGKTDNSTFTQIAVISLRYAWVRTRPCSELCDRMAYNQAWIKKRPCAWSIHEDLL